MRPAAEIAAATDAHRRLLATVDGLTEADVRAPSLLPDWNRAMLLTHLARNADSFTWLAEGAVVGELRPQYPGGHEQRSADIEAGRDRSRDEVAGDLRAACERLEAAWAGLTDLQWATGEGRLTQGATPISDLPYCRWREVEVHHRDLGSGYTEADWPADYVTLDLRAALDDLPGRLAPVQRAAWLSWLLGRTPPPDLAAVAPWRPTVPPSSRRELP